MKYILSIIIGCLVAYTLGSFVVFDFNVGRWDFASRLVTALMVIIFSCASYDVIEKDYSPKQKQ